ncbi:UDP-glycosyltransferase UGT5 [Pieris rapae]|uniref:UDP-glycosyltransferase UGT5 n=1 Tax=Pieris rapae TaxID=64459 RepID=UPI001E27EEF8|nr:UDP-glycosyltransferase UGT5 [Pieris rapae]XP_022123897.2 UDP-glycosyltransferase UGT5 [Pieris rapae]
MRLYILCFITLQFTYNVHTARILGLFPHPGKSHQMVFDPLMRKLAERGHEVTVATFFPLENPPKNYTEINLQSLAELRLESFGAEIYEYPSYLMRIPLLGSVLDQYNQHDALGTLAVTICEKLTRFLPLNKVLKQEFDAVIVERFDSACVHGLLNVYNIQAPVIGISSCALMPGDAAIMGAEMNPSFIPVVTSSFTHKMSFFERLENFLALMLFTEKYRTTRAKERAVIEGHFGKKINDLDAEVSKMSLLFVNSFFVGNGVYPLVPGIIEIGGIHIDPKNKNIPTHVEKFVAASEHGVILFSLGSQLSSTSISKEKQDIFMRAFSKLKERVIWKYADSAEEGTLISHNILRVKWLPQNELLKHPKIKAFIGHGGMLGSLEAVSAGKPLIIIPVFADQKLNAAALKDRGIAEILSLANLKEEDLEKALKNILSPSMRERARLVSLMWHDRERPPLDTAVYWTERIIKWGNQSQLYSQAKYLPFYQYALLDVTGFVIMFIIALIVTSVYIVKYLLIILRSETKEKIH